MGESHVSGQIIWDMETRELLARHVLEELRKNGESENFTDNKMIRILRGVIPRVLDEKDRRDIRAVTAVPWLRPTINKFAAVVDIIPLPIKNDDKDKDTQDDLLEFIINLNDKLDAIIDSQTRVHEEMLMAINCLTLDFTHFIRNSTPLTMPQVAPTMAPVEPTRNPVFAHRLVLAGTFTDQERALLSDSIGYFKVKTEVRFENWDEDFTQIAPFDQIIFFKRMPLTQMTFRYETATTVYQVIDFVKKRLSV